MTASRRAATALLACALAFPLASVPLFTASASAQTGSSAANAKIQKDQRAESLVVMKKYGKDVATAAMTSASLQARKPTAQDVQRASISLVSSIGQGATISITTKGILITSAAFPTVKVRVEATGKMVTVK